MDSHVKIPAESSALLESALKLLQSHVLCADEIVLMAYNLGRVDGRMEQLDRSEDILRAEFDIPGRPEHDLTTRGSPLKPGR